jgi:hypothetical protein
MTDRLAERLRRCKCERLYERSADLNDRQTMCDECARRLEAEYNRQCEDDEDK